MRAGLLALAAVLAPNVAHASCGLYVAGTDQPLVNDATQVVLMRSGTRTVLSIQNDYQGPPEDFAMVVPVPVVLHEGDVKTLPRAVFQHVEQIGAPRLVEYWEQDPCRSVVAEDTVVATAPPATPVTKTEDKPAGLGVTIEAKFAVGEYQILILSAKEAAGLETWLRQNHYTIPKGAEALLRPYVDSGSKFFVAKVDAKKVTFENGHAALSPLRVHYDADEFTLPIRLGLANSAGTQDLIVNILAPHQRYEVANYPNVTIPTNLDLQDGAKGQFAAFYAALFDRTLEKHRHAVVTEYAWSAASCDPCPGPTLDPGELMTLGGDVLAGTHDKPQPYQGYDFVLTRLHARYGQDLKDDLVFTQAEPIVGGREFVQAGGQLEQGAHADTVNNFQARYAIRHPWTGPIRCEHPQRGMWGGPPPELATAQPAPQAATALAFAPRGQVQLAAVLVKDLPDLGVSVAGALVPGASTPPQPGKKRRGCGCQSSDPAGMIIGLGTLLVALARRRLPR